LGFLGETIYDFRESHNHGMVRSQPSSRIILTDRGLYLSRASISLPGNFIEPISEKYTVLIAFWYLPLASSRLLTLEGMYNFGIDMEIYPYHISFLYNSDQGSSKYSFRVEGSKSYIESWSLFIFEIENKEEVVHITLYPHNFRPEKAILLGILISEMKRHSYLLEI
jgi:hypothetical protein